MLPLIRNPESSDPSVRLLRKRLDSFYSSTWDYSAFTTSPDQSMWFRLLQPHLLRRSSEKRKLVVLELGAGKSNFSGCLGEMRKHIDYRAQDVTPQNREWLRERADDVYVCDVSNLPAMACDVVFSTFVLEHVSHPSQFLSEVRRLLRPGGVHVVICPRYDVPGYLCPSLRHLSVWGRLGAHLFFLLSRVATLVDKEPRFYVNIDPSLFHGPWYRDADAVHIVSKADVVNWHLKNGFSVERLKPGYAGWRDLLVKRLLTLSLACTRTKD